MLHVHENVHDREYESFISNLPVELEKIGKQKNKNLHCTIVHVEKVKSYAPKVFHRMFVQIERFLERSFIICHQFLF